jgi:hypothetical protein
MMAPSWGVLKPVMLRRGFASIRSPPPCLRGFLQMVSYCANALAPRGTCQLSNDHEQAPSWPAYRLLGRLPAGLFLICFRLSGPEYRRRAVALVSERETADAQSSKSLGRDRVGFIFKMIGLVGAVYSPDTQGDMIYRWLHRYGANQRIG